MMCKAPILFLNKQKLRTPKMKTITKRSTKNYTKGSWNAALERNMLVKMQESDDLEEMTSKLLLLLFPGQNFQHLFEFITMYVTSFSSISYYSNFVVLVREVLDVW